MYSRAHGAQGPNMVPSRARVHADGFVVRAAGVANLLRMRISLR